MQGDTNIGRHKFHLQQLVVVMVRKVTTSSKAYYSDVTESHGEQTALYLEDKYQVTKNLMVVGGIRYESFLNKNKLHAKILGSTR